MSVSSLVDVPNGVFPRIDAEGWPLVPPTQITIHRTSSLDEQTRQIICALDGKRFGQVLYGETLTCEIAPGSHVLRVHNTLVWKTLTFDVEPGGLVHFTVWNKALVGYFAMLAFLGACPLGLGVVAGHPDDPATWADDRSGMSRRSRSTLSRAPGRLR